MTKARMTLVVLMWLTPAAALAAPTGHPANPPLHVDPKLDDCSVQFAPELTQAAFGRFVREFGSVSAFKLASPPTTLGQWHFAVDVEQIWFHVEEHAAAWTTPSRIPTRTTTSARTWGSRNCARASA